MFKIIDLSVPIENDVISDPVGFRPEIEYTKHKDKASIAAFARSFHNLTLDQMPDGEMSAYEHISLSTHSGTHLDAPWHYHSTTNNGKDPSPTIDQIPLDWCFQPGVKLDFRHFPDGYVVTAKDVEEELKRINYKLQPLDIVLVNTCAGKFYGNDDYINKGCGMGREATLFLLEQGVKITGTDAWSWDAPFVYTEKEYEKNKDPKIIWEGHKAGREKPYCHMEKLHNLEQLPATGFKVCCFPVKIKAASAGWTRAVAMVPDKNSDKFLGTWRLQSWTAQKDGVVIRYPYGKNPRGYINYFANGLMTVVIMSNPDDIAMEKGVIDNIFKATDQEKITGFSSYQSYWGTFSVDDEAKVVTHKLEGSLYPKWIGTLQKRHFEFKDNLLILSAEKDNISHIITWEKFL